MGEKTLDVLPVKQKGFTFFVSKLAASEIGVLCAGLKVTGQRTISLKEVGAEDPEDVMKWVKSLEPSLLLRDLGGDELDNYEENEPYQRILDYARVKEIARYLGEPNAFLPNSLILATAEEVEVALVEEGRKLKVTWDDAQGELPFNIIDGQHRVEGVKLFAKNNADSFDVFDVSVTVLVDVPFYVQAELFAVINGRQKRVPRSRIYDLLGYMPISDPSVRKQAFSGEMALDRFCHYVVRVLNTSSKSPLCGRVKMRGTGEGVVTQGALVDHLAGYTTTKKYRDDLRYLPILNKYFSNNDVTGMARLLIIYLIGVKLAKPECWKNAESQKNSLFGKTTGVAVMLSVFHDMVVDAGGVENLKYEDVKEKWGAVDDDVVKVPPKGGSKGIQDEVKARVMKSMFGDNYDATIRRKCQEMLPKLCELGSIYK